MIPAPSAYGWSRDRRANVQLVEPLWDNPVSQQIVSEVSSWAITTAAVTYARKKPLTFVGRVLGHAVPFVNIAFMAYDVYQVAKWTFDQFD